MNRTQLVAAIARRTGASQSTANATLTAVVDEVAATLAAGESVEWTGFGTFTKRAKPARPGRNPRTGDAIVIPAREVLTFKPGARLVRLATSAE